MQSFSFDLEIAASRERAFAAFWRPKHWPRVARHVVGVRLLYEDEEAQVMTMEVNTRGHHDLFKTVRVRQPEAIFYFQPTPPPILRRHYGWWHFSTVAGGTLVRSEHHVEIDVPAAARLLDTLGIQAAGDEAVGRQIETLIRNNSLQTMRALKERLEEAPGGQDVVEPADVAVV